MMAISLNGEWEGTALEYTDEERSFVSGRIVERHKLKLVDEHIRLTWKFNNSSETFVTRFFLDKDLRPDFQLGSRSRDDKFNREDVAIPANKGRKRRRSTHLIPPYDMYAATS